MILKIIPDLRLHHYMHNDGPVLHIKCYPGFVQ